MLVKSLDLLNFRSYKRKSFSFSPSVSFVIGPNACGKTNLVEAIFLLSVGRSFRAEHDREVICFGQELARVRGVVEHAGKDEVELELMITKGEVMGVKAPVKKYSVNDVGKRMIDFIGKLKVVLFWPVDLELITDSPSLRRRYLNLVLSQVDREYRRVLRSYERGLRQRNNVLVAIREGKAHRHQLIFWDQLLIKHGEYISKKREEYIDFVNSFQLSVLILGSSIKDQTHQLYYDRSVISKPRLEQYSNQEIAAGATLVGPHRDDVTFEVKSSKNCRDLSRFGSRGEQRLSVLWLKLSELAYIEEKTGEKPVLLLDDILSEFDYRHREIIFKILGRQQTIITTTESKLLGENKLKDAKFKDIKIIQLPQ